MPEKSLLLSEDAEHGQNERNDYGAGQQTPRDEAGCTVIDYQRRNTPVELREKKPEAEEDQSERCRERHPGKQPEAVEIPDVENVSNDRDECDDRDECRKELRLETAGVSVAIEKYETLRKQYEGDRRVQRHSPRRAVRHVGCREPLDAQGLFDPHRVLVENEQRDSCDADSEEPRYHCRGAGVPALCDEQGQSRDDETHRGDRQHHDWSGAAGDHAKPRAPGDQRQHPAEDHEHRERSREHRAESENPPVFVTVDGGKNHHDLLTSLGVPSSP